MVTGGNIVSKVVPAATLWLGTILNRVKQVIMRKAPDIPKNPPNPPENKPMKIAKTFIYLSQYFLMLNK